MSKAQQICVAELTAPHGVRGLLRLRLWLDDGAGVLALPLTKADGTPVRLTQRGQTSDGLLVAIDGVVDRTQAAAWRNTKLFAPRSALPAANDAEFYVADLQGLQAVDANGAVLGAVAAVYDVGAGVSLEIKQAGQKPLVVPFNNRCVPQVDVAGGKIVVDVPAEVIGDADHV